MLAEEGFGVPDNDYFNGRREEYGAKEEWRIEYDDRTAVLSHRAQAFTERFGDIPQSSVDARVQTFGETEEYVRRSYSVPSMYFRNLNFLVGSKEPSAYEVKRDEYLENIQKFHEDMGGSCNPASATPGNDGHNTDGYNTDGDDPLAPCDTDKPCTVEGVLIRGEDFSKAANPDETIEDCIKTNTEDMTGSEPGECTVEGEIAARMGMKSDTDLLAPK